MRLTWEGVKSNPLPGRKSIVIYSYRAVIETLTDQLALKSMATVLKHYPKGKTKHTSQMSLGLPMGSQLRLGPFQRTPARGEGEAFIG